MKSELTQIREGKRKVNHWRIIAGLMGLLAIYALLGKSDTDARLSEAERLTKLQPRLIIQEPTADTEKPPVSTQHKTFIGHTNWGEI